MTKQTQDNKEKEQAKSYFRLIQERNESEENVNNIRTQIEEYVQAGLDKACKMLEETQGTYKIPEGPLDKLCEQEYNEMKKYFKTVLDIKSIEESLKSNQKEN